MKNFTQYLMLALVFGLVSPAFAEMPESVKSQVKSFSTKKVATEIVEPASPVVSGSEAQTKLQAIKNQEQWVAKLTKQLEGEKNQLKEMHESYKQAFGKEPKKIEDNTD